MQDMAIMTTMTITTIMTIMTIMTFMTIMTIMMDTLYTWWLQGVGEWNSPVLTIFMLELHEPHSIINTGLFDQYQVSAGYHIQCKPQLKPLAKLSYISSYADLILPPLFDLSNTFFSS